MNEETAKERQRRVVMAGGKWEEYVRLYLNDSLKGTGIEVINGTSEESIKNRSLSLWELLSLPLKSSRVGRNVWGDIDLVAIKDDSPITVISCKLSLHGRFTETLFWSLLFKSLTRIKVVLATPDAGRAQKDRWESEWGTTENPTKDRLLAQSYLEAVYVENVEQFCKYKKPNQGTRLGGIIRPLNELPEDIKRWSVDISKAYTKYLEG
jgi:hypothetical protein